MSKIEDDARMTMQRTFDTVVVALRRQGKPSVTQGARGGGCRYRSADGAKCAAGHLIPDDLYHPNMEGCSVSLHSSIGRMIAELGHDVELVTALQIAHDTAWRDFPWEWLSEFLSRAESVAQRFNLDDRAVRAPLDP